MKKTKQKLSPDFLAKHKESLLRKNRQVIYLNDQEMAAIDRYCKKFKIDSKGSLYRELIMKYIIEELENNHPTLF